MNNARQHPAPITPHARGASVHALRADFSTPRVAVVDGSVTVVVAAVADFVDWIDFAVTSDGPVSTNGEAAAALALGFTATARAATRVTFVDAGVAVVVFAIACLGCRKNSAGSATKRTRLACPAPKGTDSFVGSARFPDGGQRAFVDHAIAVVVRAVADFYVVDAGIAASRIEHEDIAVRAAIERGIVT